MRTSFVSVRLAAGALVALLGAAGTAHAQLASSSSSATRIAGNALEIAPYGGYMMFGNFIDGPLGTSLSSSAAPIYGAQLGLPLIPGVKLIGNIAHASGDLKIGVPFLGGISAGKTSALMMDGGLQLSLPSAGSRLPYVPFLQAGVGATRWNIDLGSTGLQTNSTNLTGNVGAGLDLTLAPTVALRFMAKDYIGKFDFKQATSLNVSGKTANNFAVTAGLKVDF